MARYQINHYVETPFGQLHIFSDPAQTKKAKALIDGCPKILFEAYKDAAERYGKIIVKEAKRCINSGMPPKGATWPPLSKRYIAAMGGDDRIYFKSGQYEESIGVHKDNVYFTNGTFDRTRYFVGLPLGVTKWPARYKTKRRPLSLIRVAQILEQGAPSRSIPPRPLWTPLFNASGGKERIKTFVRNAVKRQLAKYM